MSNTPVLNNGLFVRDTSFKVESHVDSYHLLNLVKQEQPIDLGVVDLWAMTQKVEAPLYQLASFKGRNVISVDDPKGQYKWRIPTAQDLTIIVEDISDVDKPGIDGTTFRIKTNRRSFGYGSVLGFSKYAGPELYVVPEDVAKIEPHGDGWAYTVQLVNNDNFRFIDKRYLKNGTKIFRKTSVRGEHGRSYDDLGVLSSGYREYYNYVGGAEAHSHYSVSSRAALIEKNGVTANGGLKVTEIWRSFDPGLDPTITTLDGMVNKMGEDYVRRSMSNGTLLRGWLPAMEAAHVSKIARDIETYLMWGTGGRIRENADDVRLSVGLWHQLDSSYRRVYNKAQFNLDLFRSELFNFFNGKENFVGPDPKRSIVVQTGLAGMKIATEAIAKYAFAQGFTVNASDIGAITNKGMDLGFGFSFTSFVIPFIANVKFVLNPALDPVHDNDLDNPIIDGYRLSSYSFIIFDVTENMNDNIYLLKHSIYDKGLIWFVEEGDMSYMARQLQGFKGNPKISGYAVYMRQTMPSIWVKDPTKVLKIVMRNPITGLAFGAAK